jgi:hypothetical protein
LGSPDHNTSPFQATSPGNGRAKIEDHPSKTLTVFYSPIAVHGSPVQVLQTQNQFMQFSIAVENVAGKSDSLLAQLLGEQNVRDRLQKRIG